MRNKLFALVLVAVMLVMTGCKVQYEKEMPTEEPTTAKPASVTLKFRYYDEKLTGYLERCERAFEQENEGVDIVLEQVDNVQYLETINKDSANAETTPDLYILEHDDLERAYLAGLAQKNNLSVYNTDNYCEAALNACSVKNQLVAYPLWYKTTFFLYNADYVSERNVENFVTLEEFSQNVDFSTPETKSIKYIFKTNLTDLFMVYGFMGGEINIGGTTGDDRDAFELYNVKSQGSVDLFRALIDFFRLETKSSYATCLKNFFNRVILSTVASTDSIVQIIKNGGHFGVTSFPYYDAVSKTSPLSITTGIVVNPYSANADIAGLFAKYVSYDMAYQLFSSASYFSCKRDVEYDIYTLNNMYSAYEKSTPKNKLAYGDQVYPLLEIAIHNIIAGKDEKEELTSVEEYMKKQLR